jgi:hypothetical protein
MIPVFSDISGRGGESGFSTLEIHFLFLMNEFREGTYTPQGGTKQSPPQKGGLNKVRP